MIFVSHYDSPLGILYLAADEEVLKGVWFEGQKYFASGLDKKETEDKETPVLKQTKEWLDLYFAGKEPEFLRRWRRRLRVPEKGMEDPAYDPIWKDHDIRGDRQESR